MAEVLDAPVYRISDVARYVLVNKETLRTWVVGRWYSRKDAPNVRSKRLIRPAFESRTSYLLSFRNLAEAHVLATLRRHYGINMEKVRRAVVHVEKVFEDSHPLVNPNMRTDGVEIFMDRYGRLEQVSAGGQFAIRDVLKGSLERLDWSDFGAVRLFPFTRGPDFSDPRLIVIDPNISFGKPVIEGTRIPTRAIFERWAAGDSVKDLVADFSRTSLEIEEAIRCEQLKAA